MTPTPPERFMRALNDEMVPCAKPHCGLRTLIDTTVLNQVRYEMRRFLNRDDGVAIPLHLVWLAMRCLNGHTEVWRAETPMLTSSPVPVISTEETRICNLCGGEYQGRPYQQRCGSCKGNRAPAPSGYYVNGTGIKKLAPAEYERGREEFKQQFGRKSLQSFAMFNRADSRA